MNRFILLISALLLTLPALAQRKHSVHKRVSARLPARQDPPAATALLLRSDSSVLKLTQPIARPDSVSKPVGEDSTLPLIRSTVLRTAPEARILPEQVIRSYYVDLAYNKTVSIIFPTAVRSVDLGSRSIMADKATDVANVLKVKAAQIGFNETNFSVMTADGTFYSFVVNYNESPSLLALNLAGPNARFPRQANQGWNAASDSLTSAIQFAGVTATQSDMVYASDRVLRQRGRGRQQAEAETMRMRLRGVFVDDNVLYFRLAIDNRSNLNYDIDYLRYFVVDGKTAKRTSRQEIELQPIYVHNEAITTVRGHQRVERVYAFQSFTLPTDKQLLIQLGERHGGRNLALQLPNKVIMNARKR